MTLKLTTTTFMLLFIGGISAPSIAGPKHSPAHNEAVARCGAAYEAASRAAHAPQAPKGKERLHAMHEAAEAKNACIAKAPR